MTLSTQLYKSLFAVANTWVSKIFIVVNLPVNTGTCSWLISVTKLCYCSHGNHSDSINELGSCLFRVLASLGKKTDERLTLYLRDFKEMCRRAIAKKKPKIGVLCIPLSPFCLLHFFLCTSIYIKYMYFIPLSLFLFGFGLNMSICLSVCHVCMSTQCSLSLHVRVLWYDCRASKWGESYQVPSANWSFDMCQERGMKHFDELMI